MSSPPFGSWPPWVARLGDYTSSLITNVSSVAGATVTAALNTLLAAIAVNTASIAGKGARNPIWDAPTVAGTFDEEFATDPLVTQSTWKLQQPASLGVNMTRDGELDITQTIATGHFRSSVKGGTLYIQIRQNEEVYFWRTLASIPTGNRLWFAGVGVQNEIGTGNTNDPRMSLQISRDNGGVPSFNDRVLTRLMSGTERYEFLTVTGGATTTLATNTFTLQPVEGLAVRCNHGSAAAGNCSGFSFRANGTLGTVQSGTCPQMNQANQKVAFNLWANTATPVVNGANAAIFAIHFLRSVDLSAGGWLAQN